MKILEKAKQKFLEIVEAHSLWNKKLKIKMRPLKPEEAIGYPKRDDYPLLLGKEVMIQAEFGSSKGQAFTDEPSDYEGSILDILNLKLTTSRQRALFVATINAVLRELGLIEGTVHCKDSEPEECAEILADEMANRFRDANKIALVGLQPSFASHLIKKFGKERVEILDLDRKNFGRDFEGVIVKNSSIYSKEILPEADVVISTGSTVVNNTIDEIVALSKKVIFFGVTIAGVSHLASLERVCYKSH